jgi:ADP-ribose pyrophosphatase YjhB (NUDIX family)
MNRRRQITAYGELASDLEPLGGVVNHGESPASAVVRMVAEQAGVAVRVVGVRNVSAVLHDGELHEDRVLFAVSPTGGSLPVTRTRPDTGRPRRQRFAAYGLVTDPDGRMLLTRIAPGFPGAGRWHLPGGGTDFGEQPDEALLRELFEETAQRGEVTDLMTVTHRYNPAAVGPEGYPIDWHAVRVLYRVLVPVPDTPRVTEAAGGSTVDAAWFESADLSDLELTEVAQWAASQRRVRGPEVNGELR